MLGFKKKKEAWVPGERLASCAAIRHGGSIQNRHDSYNSSSAAVPVRLFDAAEKNLDDPFDWNDMSAFDSDAAFSSDHFLNEEWRTSSTQQMSRQHQDGDRPQPQQRAQQQHQQNQDSEQFEQQLSQQQQQFQQHVLNLQRRQHHSQVHKCVN